MRKGKTEAKPVAQPPTGTIKGTEIQGPLGG
jgi:hypothetical protein